MLNSLNDEQTKKMKELYLDIGNSFLKMATRDNRSWRIVFDGEHSRLNELYSIIETASDLKEVLVSSVRRDITQRITENLPGVTFRKFGTADIPVKMLNYKTPETLGLDRFLVCLGAARESQNTDVIVIDSGSACTVDMMTKKYVYCGGIIMPGLSIVKNAMKNHLPELPAASHEIPKEWPGKSTTECIEWGVNGGFLFAIRGFLEKYRATVDDPDIYITGGDAVKLIEWLGDDADHFIYRKDLIWEGMEKFASILK